METDRFPRYSGMEFVPDNAYPIEDSKAYSKLGSGVRSVEFVRITDGRLVLVEARSTIANPETSPEPYMKEIHEICDKFVHSLNLLSAIKVGIIEETLPDALNTASNVALVFVLVVRNHRAEWCRPVKQELEKLLPTYYKKIWRPLIMVINHETAKKEKFAI